jgi:threonine/homoserine/homoserine lactone efflux protein
MQDPLLFALTVLTILGTPGPTNTLLATGGASVGFRRALLLIPAEGAGYLIAILCWGLLVGPLLASSPPVNIGLRLLVGCYLLHSAVRQWNSGALTRATSRIVISPRHVFLTTLLNPKAIVFALAVIPLPRPWAYIVAFLCLTAAVATAWIFAGAAMGSVAAATGRSHIVARVGAAFVGIFATMLMASPLFFLGRRIAPTTPAIHVRPRTSGGPSAQEMLL